jgi:hypothetical protein
VGANPLLATLGGSGQEGPLGGGKEDDREGDNEGDKEAERTMRSQLRDRDRQLGLGASGPVVAAVEDIARTSTASIESHAVLDVVANGEGEIVSVSVTDVSEDRAGWQEIAKSLLASLRTKRLRVPHRSRGVAMTIEVDSRESLPSGAAPGVNVALFDQKIAHGKNERAASVTILPLAKIAVTHPGKPGETTTLVLPVPVPIIAGTFDVSDIGARGSRIVHARATNEREL